MGGQGASARHTKGKRARVRARQGEWSKTEGTEDVQGCCRYTIKKVEGVGVMVNNMNQTAEEIRVKIQNCEVEAKVTGLGCGLNMFLSANAKLVLQYNSLLTEQVSQAVDKERLRCKEVFLVGQQFVLAYFRFGEHPTVLEEKSEALDCKEQCNLALSERRAVAKRNGADIGSFQQPLVGQASVCSGTYSLGETSHAQFPPSASKEPETPLHGLAVQVRPKNKSSKKKKSFEKVTSVALVVGREMLAKELFIPIEGTETEMVSALGPLSSEEGNDIEALQDPIDCTLGGQNLEDGLQGSSEHDLPMDDADNVVGEDPEPQYAMAEEGPQEFATQEDEVAKLKATIAELIKQQAKLKVVVRQPPAFEGVPGQIVGSTVKTKKVSDVGKGGNSSSSTTRNKGKVEKVRNRADGPSETMEVIGSGLKKSKKKKVEAAADETINEDDDHMTLDGFS